MGACNESGIHSMSLMCAEMLAFHDLTQTDDATREGRLWNNPNGWSTAGPRDYAPVRCKVQVLRIAGRDWFPNF